jgi:hypothetical protein
MVWVFLVATVIGIPIIKAVLSSRAQIDDCLLMPTNCMAIHHQFSKLRVLLEAFVACYDAGSRINYDAIIWQLFSDESSRFVAQQLQLVHICFE